jgi:hypothetical protein
MRTWGLITVGVFSAAGRAAAYRSIIRWVVVEIFVPCWLNIEAKVSELLSCRYRLSSSRAPPPKTPPSVGPAEARPFYIRPDKLLDVVTASVPILTRAGTGAFVLGYGVKVDKEKGAGQGA